MPRGDYSNKKLCFFKVFFLGASGVYVETPKCKEGDSSIKKNNSFFKVSFLLLLEFMLKIPNAKRALL
jgi:hypothetical protein